MISIPLFWGPVLSDVVLRALERELAQYEWHERLAQRLTTDLGGSAASLLAQERQQRERDLPSSAMGSMPPPPQNISCARCSA
jgi:hypothetical protein